MNIKEEKFVVKDFLEFSKCLYVSSYHIRPIVPYVGNDVESLDLGVRAFNCLKRHCCNTVDDVIAVIKENKLHEVRNLGEKLVKKLLRLLKSGK